MMASIVCMLCFFRWSWLGSEMMMTVTSQAAQRAQTS